MKSIPSFLTLVGLLAWVPMLGQSVETLIQERIDAEETPGIAVAIHQDGKTIYYAYGYADLANQRKVDSKTLFEIGSITKTFTTVMAAQLAEEGKLSLDDPIQKFLPQGVTAPTRAEKVITFADLASARSGLPRMPENFHPADESNPYIDYTEAMLFSFLSGYSLTRDIGSQYEYSNLGMGLLGVLVGRIESKAYREAVSTRILTPLKMKSTFMNTPGRTDKNAAVGYSGKQAAKAWTWTDQSSLQGAGGLLSNAEDMMTYLLANLSPGTDNLGRAMTTSHQPRMDIGRNNMKIGLGWHIRNKIVWHNGGTGGFRSFAGFDPEKKLAVVILTNSTTSADDLGFHLLDETIPLKKIRKPVNVPTAVLQSYVGKYEITPGFQIEVTLEKDQLSIQATNQPKAEIFAESDVKFYLKIVEAQIEFMKNTQGEIEKLVLYQNGQALNGVRLK